MDNSCKELKGKKLYKYVSLSNWDFENIFKEQLFLQTASFFNDVFDSAPFWIEVGKAIIEGNSMILYVYEKALIHNIDIGVILDLILEHLKKIDYL